MNKRAIANIIDGAAVTSTFLAGYFLGSYALHPASWIWLGINYIVAMFVWAAIAAACDALRESK